MNCKSYSHFFSKKFQHICVSIDVNFNESLTKDIVSFEQLDPDLHNINAHTKFGENPMTFTQVIVRKRKYEPLDRRTADGRTDDQCGTHTIIPFHYDVAGYKKGQTSARQTLSSQYLLNCCLANSLLKSVFDRYRPDRTPVRPITVRYIFSRIYILVKY